MTARSRKVWADLISNKARSALAIAALAAGVTAVGGMHIAATEIDSAFTRGFEASNPPSAMLGTSPFEPSLVEELADHPAVGDVEARLRQRVRITRDDGERVSVELVAMRDFADNDIARIEPEPEDGVWPPAPDSVVLERATRRDLGLSIGDFLVADVNGGEPVSLRVSGTAFDVWEVAPTLGGSLRGYVADDTIAALSGSDQADTLFLRAATDPTDRESALSMVAAIRDDVLAPADVVIELGEIRDPSRHRADQSLGFVVDAMQLLAVLALVVAVALVVNTVSALLAEQRSQIGVMKTIGASTRSLTVNYLALVAALSATALVIAIPASIALGRFVARFAATLANFDLAPFSIRPTALLIEVIVGVAVPTLAVIAAVRRACRVTVRDAITDRGLVSSTSVRPLWLHMNRPMRLAYRNATRNRLRLALTVMTVGVTGAVLVGVLSTSRSLDALTDEVMGYADYDIEIRLAEPVDLAATRAALAVEDGVEAVEGWSTVQAFQVRSDGVENENVSITGVPRDTTGMRPTLLDGRWFDLNDDDPIVINTHLADEAPDLDVGDAITLDIEGRRRDWTIVGVASTTLVGPVAYVPADDLLSTPAGDQQANLIVIQLRSGADLDTMSERLEARAQQAGLPVVEIRTNTQIRAFYADLFAIVTTLLLVVGAILAVVAVIGVAGAMTLGVIEQTREIGVLRTLGATTWAIRLLLLRQGLTIGVAGFLLGLAMSVPVAWLLRTAIANSLVEAAVPAHFSWSGAALWAALAISIGAIATTQPARTASRLTVHQTLAYE